MIKLFFYDNYNPIIDYFQEEGHNIPFLGSNLFDFTSFSIKRFADLNNQTLQIFTPPEWESEFESWSGNFLDYFGEDHSIFIFTDVFSVPLSDFTKEDYHFLIQNPDKIFHHESGMKIGYINKNTDLSRVYKDELQGFNSILRIEPSNFLKVNQSLISNFSSGQSYPGNYGNPVILTGGENIHNSRILGPSFIGEDVKIYNSIIYPGTVVTGNCIISNSEVFESFICESSIRNSVVKNTLTAMANIDEVDLQDSIIPRGSVLNNVRKR